SASSTGIDPLKLLFPRSNVVSAVQSPISTGICPCKKFEFKLSTERAVRLPISLGMLPVKLLESRSITINGSSERYSGIEPLM
ncbi:hypothetical protein QQP08_010986, partial [Theobroma cacao]